MSDSSEPLAQRLAAIRTLVPEAWADGKLDFARLRELLGGEIDDAPERFGLQWAGKREALRLIDAPSLHSLAALPNHSVRFDDTRHVLIEADNLHALKLLRRAYYGQVKLIYIDPPYNTGRDFVYRDRFQVGRDAYLQQTGQRDRDGIPLVENPETSGRFHSEWLSMLYPRLAVARELLRPDGVIFVSIDDNEVDHLRLLLSELFGRENLIAQIVVQTNPRGRTLDRFLAKTHEYLLVYARDISEQSIVELPKGERALAQYNRRDAQGGYRELELRNRNPVFNRSNRPNLFYPLFADPENGEVQLGATSRHTVEIYPRNLAGEDGCWTWSAVKTAGQLGDLSARQVKTGAWRVFRKDRLPAAGATTKAKALWLEREMNHEHGKEELGRLLGQPVFDFPKSPALVEKCVQLGTSPHEGDLVLDFFAGSGTTAQAVLEANHRDGGNRRFLLVQVAEPLREPARLQDGSTLTTIADICAARIRAVIARIQSSSRTVNQLDQLGAAAIDLGFRMFRQSPSTRAPQLTANSVEPSLGHSVQGLRADANEWDVAIECLTSAGMELSVPIRRESHAGTEVYSFDDGKLLFALGSGLSMASIESILAAQPQKLICRDQAFAGRDDVKLQLACNCRSRGIAFEAW